MIRRVCVLLIVFTLLCSFQDKRHASGERRGGGGMALRVTSTAFEQGGMIPRQYTCDGRNVSPPLAWTNVPGGTKTLAIICDDPDAPMGTWVHWVLFNVPSKIIALAENVPPQKILESGAKHGINDFRRLGYGGPCPPRGTHRYHFKLYALDIELDLHVGVTKVELLKAMDGHILAEGQLMGKYKR